MCTKRRGLEDHFTKEGSLEIHFYLCEPGGGAMDQQKKWARRLLF
jgi:hypothetical protein